MIAHFYVKQKRHFKYPARRPSRPTGLVEWYMAALAVARMLTIPPKGSDIDTHFSNLVTLGIFDYNELDKLLEYAKDPQSRTANHRLGGPLWPEEKLEWRQTGFKPEGFLHGQASNVY